jgi:hypothetical protein
VRDIVRGPSKQAILSALLVGAMAAASSAGCAREAPKIDEAALMALKPEMKAELESAQKVRFFFSHHSVGANLLEGARGVSAAVGADLKIVSFADGATPPASGWIEAVGGENGDPKSKIDYFVHALRDQPALKPDLAMMKFCYLDFGKNTDVNAVFDYYRDAIMALKKARPDVRFAHATAPLKVTPTGIKSTIQRTFGRDVGEDVANTKRAEYNRRLMETFAADPIFDLSRFESTRPDGSRETYQFHGKEAYALFPAYSSDGGHLNDVGKRLLGSELIRFVAQAGKPVIAGGQK